MARAMQLVLAIALVAITSPAHAAESSVQVVARLYRNFAWEAVLAQPGATGLAQQPVSVLMQYFTPKLASALAEDAACAERRREVCALDFTLLWASQDPAAQDLYVTAGDGPSQVQVRFTYPSTRQVVQLTFRLVHTHSGWRVADIVYPSSPSLAQQLASGAE